MSKVAKLIMVTENNNNKFYNMELNDSGTIQIHYGRVGTNGSKTSKPESHWNKIYNSKTKKGYVDQTELFIIEDDSNTVKTKTKTNTLNTDGFLKSRVASVINIVKKLQSWAKGSVSENYTVSSEDVTEKQVKKAQEVLDTIVNFDVTSKNYTEFNKKLLEFYSIVPRKMKNVKNYILNSDDDLTKRKNEIISEEQATLDVMSGQVKLNVQTDTDTTTDVKEVDFDIISASGLDMDEVTDPSIITKIKKLMGPDSGKFSKAFVVVNNKTQSKFDTHLNNAKDKKCELFWHGSRNENWWSIMTGGLLIRPSNAVHTGSMFGDGIYYASKFRKSFGYTSGRRSYWAKGNSNIAIIALYDVHVGNQKHIKHHNSSCYDLSANVLDKDGYDSVYAHGGADLRNDEFIVYKSEQSTIKYLVIVDA